MNWLLIKFAILVILLNPLQNIANDDNFNKNPVQSVTRERAVATLPKENITLYATERDGYLQKFRLEVNGNSRLFPYWMNVSEEAFSPKIYFNDINSNGEKGLIIVLTTGTGTGIIEQNVHVFHKTKSNLGYVYKEILVDNPMAIISKNVKTNLTKSEAIIKIGNKETVINIENLGIKPENLFSDISTGNIIKFDVLNNELTAIIGAQVSPVGGFIGNFHISYIFKDNMYQMKKIEFIANEN
ncbi:hypothetical protein JFL43_09510 [Viridibacillus sp. YIM B01967]|uniref:Uncharacterized protein n=1 Tax=Viridibacillus soli TaxID=2798301 RepID=A0ABS1H713_9BACL|nr:hypothetical protein [Viridibacillus soli]MBK3495089.1 hypothetical protein [Viridibacillus soli]